MLYQIINFILTVITVCLWAIIPLMILGIIFGIIEGNYLSYKAKRNARN